MMNEVWNLEKIYTGFDDPAFAADMEALKKIVADFNAFAGNLSGMDALAGLKQGIAWEEELTKTAMKLGEYAQLRQTTNTRDSEAGSRMGQVMAHRPSTALR